MTEFIFSVLAFIAAHVLPAIGPVRAFLVRRLGTRTYIILYSIVSLALLVWLGSAFMRAPVIEIWPQLPWARRLPIFLMLLSSVLIVGGLVAANPFSLTFRKKSFDPQRPGLIGLTHHPVFWGFALWAASHIPVNGEGAPVILFSLLLALSVYGPISMNRKRRRALGETEWARLNSGGKSMSGANGWIAGLFGGGGLYILFLYIHETVIGVSPLP